MFRGPREYSRRIIYMPIYEFKCLDCAAVEQRLAGPHDIAAICARCNGMMLRFDDEAMGLYFDKVSQPVIIFPLKPGATK